MSIEDPRAYRPLEPTGPRVLESRSVSHILSGVVLLLASVPAAMFVWGLLPPGHYPVVISGVASLPFLWLGFRSFRKGGLPVEEFARAHPTIFKYLVALVALGVAVGIVLYLDQTGQL